MIISLFLSLNFFANALIKEDFKKYTSVLQVPTFYAYSDYEKCKIAKWVHENNSLYVTQMYLNGYVAHPERLKSSSNDIKDICLNRNRKDIRTRCSRYEDCNRASELFRIIMEEQ